MPIFETLFSELHHDKTLAPVSREELCEDWNRMFAVLDRLQEMISHPRFRSLSRTADVWSVEHLSFDNESISAVMDSDVIRLLESWEHVAESFDEYTWGAPSAEADEHSNHGLV